jgi:hypothetical protein
MTTCSATGMQRRLSCSRADTHSSLCWWRKSSSGGVLALHCLC